MKKILLILGVLLAACALCCGIYLVGNRITRKAKIEALNGTYTLTHRELKIPPQFEADTLLLNLPQIGEQLVLHADGDSFRIEAAAEVSPMLQSLAGTVWESLYCYRTWFDDTHILRSTYTTTVDGQLQGISVSWSRIFWEPVEVLFSITLPIPAHPSVGCQLLFQKTQDKDSTEL